MPDEATVTDKRAKQRLHVEKYGHRSGHRRLRAGWRPIVARGGVLCARCGLPIIPSEPFDLDHADDGRGYLGDSHRRCNRATAGRRAKPEPPLVTSRAW